MNVHHIERADATIQTIVKRTFGYRGKKIKLSTQIPSRLRSYWDGGSRDSFCFYQLSDGKTIDVHSNHPYFEKDQPSQLNGLPDGVILVKHTIFCGKDMGITIYANPTDLAPMLPKATSETTRNERIVLRFTASLKNTYGGETNIRFREANRASGISEVEWTEAQASLVDKGMLAKNLSITPSGRNVNVDDVPRY